MKQVRWGLANLRKHIALTKAGTVSSLSSPSCCHVGMRAYCLQVFQEKLGVRICVWPLIQIENSVTRLDLQCVLEHRRMFREGRPVSEHGRGFGKKRTQIKERRHEAEDKTSSVAILHLQVCWWDTAQPVLSGATVFSLLIHMSNTHVCIHTRLLCFPKIVEVT